MTPILILTAIAFAAFAPAIRAARIDPAQILRAE
jgi:ABC-type antimicrobial peptide transport system permease subunit